VKRSHKDYIVHSVLTGIEGHKMEQSILQSNTN